MCSPGVSEVDVSLKEKISLVKADLKYQEAVRQNIGEDMHDVETDVFM